MTDLMLCLFPDGWKGRKFKSECRSILQCCSIQVELSIYAWPFIPIRKLPLLPGSTGKPRNQRMDDVSRKEELLYCANRAGCGLIATRLNKALAVNASDLVSSSL